MKKEVDCGVIRDLLPLYEDGVASEESQELVRVHLKDCPDCREELRKMRTPISMPPDEDEEAVKRFLERREEIRKKQNRKLICIAVPLAVLIMFCLCYTLIPRSWSSVGGTVEPDFIMGNYCRFTINNGIAGADLWVLDNGKDSETINAFLDALRAESYRAELRNVLNYTPLAPFQDTSVHGLDGSIQLYLVKDNDITVSVYLYDTSDHKVFIHFSRDPGTFFYHTDGKAFEAAAALMQEYGEYRE